MAASSPVQSSVAPVLQLSGRGKVSIDHLARSNGLASHRAPGGLRTPTHRCNTLAQPATHPIKGGKAATCAGTGAGTGDSARTGDNNRDLRPDENNCTLPLPSTLFRDNTTCTNGVFRGCENGCNRTLVTPECKATSGEVHSGQECRYVCSTGSTGRSVAECNNGTWVDLGNDCTTTLDINTCSNSCKSNANYPSWCNEDRNQCACPTSTSYLDAGNPVYGCVTDLTQRGFLYGDNIGQRCAVRITENPAHYDACETSPLYPGPSTTKCTQVSTIAAPVRSKCPLGNCAANNAECWTQIWTEGEARRFFDNAARAPGWVQSGPDCLEQPYGYLAPCDGSTCKVAPSSEVCKVEAAVDNAGGVAGLAMRTAPCPNAPAVEVGGKDLIIPTDSSFKYLDRNTRQSSDCGGYGFLGAGSLFGTTTDYCWVLGSYNGFVGWVAVQSIEYQINGGWSSSLCTFFAKTPSLLVSDDGSATGCAQLTPDLVGDPEKGCFPADAVALLKGVGAVRMSDLALGDTVAVRRADGSVGFEPVYAFGHRDANITTVFAELSVAVGAQGSESTIQATPDHFVLTGSEHPTYERAEEVKPGDTVWLLANPKDTQLTPARVVSTRRVTNIGLYAPLTLSGSIIVNNVAASVHSTWFADVAWAALGLPDAWLHTLYQAVLAPVRGLWHVWPKYQAYYAYIEETHGLAAAYPDLFGLVAILASALGSIAADLAAPTLRALAASAAVAFITLGAATAPRQGTPSVRRTASQAAPLLVVLGICLLVCMAQGARIEEEYDAVPAPADASTQHADPGKGAHTDRSHHKGYGSYKKSKEHHPDYYSHQPEYSHSGGHAYKPGPTYEPGLNHHPGQDPDSYGQHSYGPDSYAPDSYGPDSYGPHNYAPDSYYGSDKHEWIDPHYPYGHKPHHTHDSYGHKPDQPWRGCRGLPNATLTNGVWSCSDKVPVGGKCTGKCNGLGGPVSVQCTKDGWSSTVTGNCLPTRRVCVGLPSVTLANTTWPEGCRNMAVGGFCLAKCTNGAACKRSTGVTVSCTRDGWEPVARPAFKPVPASGIITSTSTCLASSCEVPDDSTLPNGFWDPFCRDYGLGVGDTCKGTCKYASAAISEDFLDNPYLFCGQNGIEIRNAGLCLPP